MSKRVLDVGQCDADHASISWLIMEGFDAEVVRAHSDIEVMSALSSDHFDLVLINRKLDRDHSDGIDIIHQIKSDPIVKDVPVMLVTNFADHQALAIEAGAIPGFGKAELEDLATREKLADVLS